jgi:hypothetical protein
MDKPKLKLGQFIRLRNGGNGRPRTVFVSKVIEHEEIGDVVFEFTDVKGRTILVYQKEIRQEGEASKAILTEEAVAQLCKR